MSCPTRSATRDAAARACNVDRQRQGDKKAPGSACRITRSLDMPDAQPNVFDANCDSREVLALITHRWTVLVIYALGDRTRRYNELKAMIGGVSQKMLTQTLRQLEREGLVSRTDYQEVPPRVEYSLTPLGRTLLET